MAYEILVSAPVIRPSYVVLETAYRDYRGKPNPVGSSYRNQCAVRMSVALGRAGFNLDTFPDKNRVKTREFLPVPFVVGAHELARYIESKLGRADRLRPKNSSADSLTAEGRRGIIYFNDCFKRGDGSAGDHIDLWNGNSYFNQINNLPAGAEDPSSSGNLFRKSNAVWFWDLV